MPDRRSSLILVAVAAVLTSILAVPAQARVSAAPAQATPADPASEAAQETLRTVRGLLDGDGDGRGGGERDPAAKAHGSRRT